MKYLSDPLYVTIPTSVFEGKYVTYEVKMISPSFIGSSFNDDIEYQDIYEVIYTGSIYGTGEDTKIYLNDIISTYVYDNSYIYNHLDKMVDFTYLNPTGVLFEIQVYIKDYFAKSIDATPYIMNFYKDANNITYNNMDTLDNQFIPIAYNLLNQRTYVYPRIPKLLYPTNNFWVSGLIATNMAWTTTNVNASKHNIFFIAGRNGSEISMKNYATTSPSNKGLVTAFTLKGDKYYDIVSSADQLVFAGFHALPEGQPQTFVPIANIDKCPADYYLIWIDRTGAYQCQPFSGKVTLTESISTSYRDTLIDTSVPTSKTITNQWKLNSEWLNYDEYKAYESIFTSKYLYLYNTQYDEGYEVVLDTNQWIEKTQKNKDKMFNLQIDVKSARPQNIIY